MQTGKNNDIRERDRQYIAGTYSRFPTVMSEGSGAVVTTDDGRECIDLGSGIAVNIFGHRDPEWVAAVTGQLGRLAHASNLILRSRRPFWLRSCAHVPSPKRCSFQIPVRKPMNAPSRRHANTHTTATVKKEIRS